MQRYSISLDDDLAEWVETQADERGVSKAKVIRDAVATARDQETSQPYADRITERLEELETRVATLEAQGSPAGNADREDVDTEAQRVDGGDSSSHQPVGERKTSDNDIVSNIEAFLAERPPQTEQGKAAVMTTFRRLRELEEAQTGQLQDYVFERHSEGYSSARSLWQSIQRHLEDIPGIEKAGYGTWKYVGDTAARDELENNQGRE